MLTKEEQTKVKVGDVLCVGNLYPQGTGDWQLLEVMRFQQPERWGKALLYFGPGFGSFSVDRFIDSEYLRLPTDVEMLTYKLTL